MRIGLLRVGFWIAAIGFCGYRSAASNPTDEPGKGEGFDRRISARNGLNGDLWAECRFEDIAADSRFAEPLEGIGDVDFPVSTADPRTRRLMNQGIALIHGLWFDEAERSFRLAAVFDGGCAMAYWGMALASIRNEARARVSLDQAIRLRRTGPMITAREGMYIDALDAYLRAGPAKDRERRTAYVEALENILLMFPDDLEARAFLAYRLWSDRRAGLSIGGTLAADSLLDPVLKARPDHPGRATRLLLWEANPAVAIDSARRCGPSTPAIPTTWHLSGHVFERLGRLDQAVRRYEAAARVYNSLAIRSGLQPDQVAGLAHNNECLARVLAETGRVREAIDLAQAMIDLPRHPLYNRPGLVDSNVERGRRLLERIFSRFEMWNELIAEAERSAEETSFDPTGAIDRLRRLGRADFANGNPARGRERLAAVERRRLWAAAVEASDGLGTLATEGSPTVAYIQRCDQAAAELRGRSETADGRAEEGLRLVRDSLGLDPLELVAALFDAGRLEEAENLAIAETERIGPRPLALAYLTAIRWRAGREQEAEQTFRELRNVSDGIDLDIPPFARLAPTARALGYPRDWRSRDSALGGSRRSLEALGPVRWTPPTAPERFLKESAESAGTIAAKQARPVVVIFFLGAGCLHCVEQLEAFAPRTHAFSDAGIDLIGVSTDDRATLRKSFDGYGPDGFPFPLESDAEQGRFRRFRVYDEVLGVPLHGTFLIDGDGRIRWSEIGREPFTDVEFLLKESRRLLSTQTRRKTIADGRGAFKPSRSQAEK